ncbi:MAG: DUF58 domain-containing protein [Alphaproteobacteria bacterium]|nr:DUF58 domain-containing protein [Alphaproteobacteria bacterium]
MSYAPAPTLLTRLTRSKLVPRWAGASVGVGERRSKQKGAGMEFADHREYQPGDDFRYLDVHVHARLGKRYIKQYDVYRALPVYIIVDSSRSMAYGGKFQFAMGVASALGFIGLAGGDRVEIAVGTGNKVTWSPRFQGVMRGESMFRWLNDQKPSGRGEFAGALRSAIRHLTDKGLLIVLSDWWGVNFEDEVSLLGATGQEIWGLHVASPEEIDPAKLGDGEVRLTDVETGQEVEIALDSGTQARYRKAFGAWREQIAETFAHVQGRYILMPTDQPTDRLYLTDWRALGMIG